MKKRFNNFDPISSKQWKQRIQFELDGADYNDILVWNSPEDIKVKPFYHRDESQQSLFTHTKSECFKICQNIFVHDEVKSNIRALSTLKKGAESILFTVNNDQIDIEKLLKNIPLEKTPVYFNLGFLSEAFIKKIDEIALQKKGTIYCNLDPIGHLAKDGNWFKTPENNNFETIKTLSKSIQTVSFISVNCAVYQNAGATLTQQIAYSLAHVNEYLNRIKTIHKPIVFQVSVGSNYFFEIAKLRALRLLFGLIAKEYDHHLDCHLLVSPTKRNKTVYDFDVNLIRTTSECMSAILGGADAVSNLAFDGLFRKDNDYSDSIARNQLRILKHESYLDKVNNPVDGSYYIESLTYQLAEKALILFQDIEKQGGFLKQLNEGVIQRKIQESAHKEQALFDAKKEILVGINAYCNTKSSMKDALELYPFLKIKPRKTLITPIIATRLAEKLEQKRLKEEPIL